MLFETHAWVTLDNAVAVYNLYSNTLLSTVPVGLNPAFLARTPDGTKILVPNSGSNTVSILCTSANRVISTIPVGINPTSVVIDPTSTTAYVTNSGSGTVSIISIPTEIVIATIAVGSAPSRAVLSIDGSLLYVSNTSSDSLSVINTSSNAVIATIHVGVSPLGLMVSLDNTKLFVTNSGSNTVQVFDTATLNLLTTIPVGLVPNSIALNPVNPNLAYVTHYGSNQVTVISTSAFNIITTIPVGVNPQGISVSPDGTEVWIANTGSNTLSVINTASNLVTAVLPAPYPPMAVTVGRVGSTLSPGNPIDLTDPYQLEEITESVCIIAEKVYASCQQRECFSNLSIELPCAGVAPYSFVSMTFANGIIVPGSLTIIPIPSRPNFAQVQFTLQIPYTLRVRDNCGTVFTLSGVLPDIYKDVILYFPPTRPEFEFNIRVETRSELLTCPTFCASSISVNIGTFVITKVTGIVQLLVPAFGFCPEPPMCEDLPLPVPNPCEVFLDPLLTSFPVDFFPPQLDTCPL